jgi:hypothetical protein
MGYCGYSHGVLQEVKRIEVDPAKAVEIRRCGAVPSARQRLWAALVLVAVPCCRATVLRR